jgi:hypothetical protein
MGQEALHSRGTTQISRRLPFETTLAGHFALTNISLPCNAGIAVQTNCRAS